MSVKHSVGSRIIRYDGQVGTVKFVQEPNPPWHDGGACFTVDDDGQPCGYWHDALPCPDGDRFIVRYEKTIVREVEFRLTGRDNGRITTETLRDVIHNRASGRRETGEHNVDGRPDVIRIAEITSNANPPRYVLRSKV